MATINLCGFETRDSIECMLGSGVGGYSFQSGTARNGGYALNVTMTGGGLAGWAIGALESHGIETEASVSTSYVRFYFRFSAVPTDVDIALFSIRDMSSNDKLLLQLSTSGNLVATPYSGTPGTGSHTLSPDTWYRINVKCESSPSTSWEVLVDGAADSSGTASDLAGNAAHLMLGRHTSDFGTDTLYFFYDDVLWDDSAHPGAGACAILLPSADSSLATDGVANGDTNKWQCVDDVPNDGDTTYVNGMTGGQTYRAVLDTASLLALGTLTNVVVKILVICLDDTLSASSLAVSYYSPSEAYAGNNTAWEPGLGTYHLRAMILDAINSNPWDNTNLEDLEAGWIDNDATNASRTTAIYAMVNYLTSSPPDPDLPPRRARRTTQPGIHPTALAW